MSGIERFIIVLGTLKENDRTNLAGKILFIKKTYHFASTQHGQMYTLTYQHKNIASVEFVSNNKQNYTTT